MSDDECAACLAAVEASGAPRGVVIASGSLPPGAPEDFYAQAARLVARAGGNFILDTSERALRPALSEPIFLAKLNQAELSDLAGHSLDEREALIAFARELVERRKFAYLAVTLGAAGAMLISSTDVYSCPSPRINARTPVGAGDSFLAALVVGLFNKEPIERTLRFAVCAGAAAASGEGTTLVDPNTAADILRKFERQLEVSHREFAGQSTARS